MSEEKTLEGWVPEVGPNLTLAQVIDLAFDYRGDVTIVKKDGTETVGYLFNRNSDVPVPFIHLFGAAGNGPFKMLYSEIQNIKFTGKDTAFGKSWEAWAKKRDQLKAKLSIGLADESAEPPEDEP